MGVLKKKKNEDPKNRSETVVGSRVFEGREKREKHRKP